MRLVLDVLWRVVLVVCGLTALTAGDAKPAVPAALAGIDAQVRAFPGSLGPGLVIRGKAPLTAEHWDAIAVVPVTSFGFAGAVFDAVALERLTTLRVEVLQLEGCRVEDAAPFARLTALRRLSTSHCHLRGIVAALTAHPALEELISDSAELGSGIGAIATAPKLTRIRLGHGAASDHAAATLVGNTTLEHVDFWATGAPVLTEAGVTALLGLTNLRTLKIHNTVVTWDGSLHRLKTMPHLTTLVLGGVDLPPADLERLKAELPQLVVTANLMTPDQRTTWDANLAYRRTQEANAAKKRAAEDAAKAKATP